ncbi:MAG: M23 family metallopeptidase [Woeseiaceae bacterium]|nr:M23 family metallopeptidase [Woeseiaceae bacterium]
MKRRHRTFVLPVCLSLVAACGGDGSAPAAPPDKAASCDDLVPTAQSLYVLPYTVGDSFRVNQANCSGFGHSGFWLYGYDFVMDIGTVVTAARSGTVVHANDGAQDGDRDRTNLVTIEHEDGTVALYSHLTLNGVLVTAGQTVNAGDTIGLSGDTGNTGGLPHLHFSLHPCSDLPGLPGAGSCPSIFVNFRNTSDNDNGLETGVSYLALPFEY